MHYTDRMHTNLLHGAIAVATAGLLLATCKADKDRQVAEQVYYCQQVDLFRASHGAEGWPDYAGSYAQACPGAALPGSTSGSTRRRQPPGARLP